jgi:hypothetical protein
MSPCFQTPPGDPYYADGSGVTYATEQDCNDHCSELGACCRGDICYQETRCQCEQNNEGAFQGIGVPCSAAPCPCIIKQIQSIEVTITAQDVSFEGQCSAALSTHCGTVGGGQQGHSSFFPGASYSGTYSLTKLSDVVWTYSWSASGQVCGGSIVAAVGRGTVQLSIRVIGIRSLNFGSSSPRPTSQLACEYLYPQVSGIECNLTQPYLQDQCDAYVFAALPCRNSEASMSALPMCAVAHGSCSTQSDEKSGAQIYCGMSFGSICITSVSIEYVE